MNTYRTSLILLFTLPVLAFASAGLSPERIWTSEDPLVAGRTVTVSTIVQNATGEQFVGSVRFQNGTTTIGTRQFSLASGDASVVSLEWTVPQGEHRLTASIIDATVGTTTFSATGTAAMTGVLERIAHMDTDADGIIDDLDTDDDNDGILDVSDDEPLNARILSPATTTAPAQDRLTLDFLPGPLERAVDSAEDTRLSHTIAVSGYLHDAYIDLAASLGRTTKFSSSTGERGVTLGWENGATWKEFIRSVDSGDLVRSPWVYTKFFIAAVYLWIVERPWAFYLAAFLALIWVIRVVSGLIHR